MKTKKLVVLCLVSFVTLSGCHRFTNEEKIQKLGINGSHDLLRAEQTSGITGSMAGIFFLGSGSISGQMSSETQIRFYWGRKPEEIIATTLPYSSFLFVIDSTKKIPTVEFIFSEIFLNYFDLQTHQKNLEINPNPNSWIMSANLQQAIVRISKEDLQKEVYLPK